MTIPLKLFHKIDTEHSPTNFTRPELTWYQNHIKPHQWKLQTNFPLNIDTKTLSKILTSQIQQQIKTIIQDNQQVGFILKLQGYIWINKCSLPDKQTKRQNHMIILLYVEKPLKKIQQPFMIKSWRERSDTGTYLNKEREFAASP